MRVRRIPLDYGDAASPKLLRSISAVAWSPPYLWTASDETRTVERLVEAGRGYRLDRQFLLDDVFTLPGRRTGAEADLEALAAEPDGLWICGSHCRSRPKVPDDAIPDVRIADQPSRQLLGHLRFADGEVVAAAMAPVAGPRSLRARLAREAHVAPFMHLPTKENGLDIEGLTVFRNALLVGLRAPVVDTTALVFRFPMTSTRNIGRTVETHYIDLGGLGVRDLASAGSFVYVVAGPVGKTGGPFRLYQWTPARGGRVEKPRRLHDWPLDGDRPEGVCAARRGGTDGLLVVYDDAKDRIRGSRFEADWIAASHLAT
jgi:hypothetical protein